jgi:pyruvate/2-oxoglutarate dehydrogenase complex dihydrolipoamide acyltransferase (E2) component
MCFKTPKPPQPTAQELAAEAEAKSMRDAAAAEAARRLADEKQRRLEEGVIRASGNYGVRSLISGRKGGQGFMRSLLGA